MWPAVVHTDQALLQSVKQSDRAAFTELYHRYSIRLYRNLLPMVKSPEIAEEIIQDLFIKVWEKRNTIEIEGNLAGYLFKIGENLVYDFFRKAAQDRQLKEQLAYYMSAGRYDTALDSAEQEQRLLKAIEQLPPQRKRIFQLCKLEGKSYQDVSLQLGISVATVNDHIVKATKAIQKTMASQTMAYFFLLMLLEGTSQITSV